MEKIVLILLLIIIAITPITSAYAIYVSYPKSVYIGQNFTITFGLLSTVINSTNFQFMTPGTKIVNVSGKTAYEGFLEYWLADKVNVSNSSELIVTFIGTVVGTLTGAPA
ncbi:hypothetical protein SJAV_01530 [Sulfurisphaera javensis]|uniref:Uncharacterized protein n=1 Tax=Sulfurisphaera javensis TaxID=2049879 RepID=A0AAT9GN58_9CREN